ncbi:MAG: 4-hydroxy-tetrahydrodipicolinate synthase [Bacteroidota bacterium]|nr:4-hydroxy-tetrahydrodipicolinate synthase [Bacteroidota bacterium]
MINKFLGTGVAIVTPFRKDGSIDFKAFEKLIEKIIKGKVEYIVVLGTTGEVATLSKDEKNAILNFVVDTVNKRVPIVRGLGGYNTQESVNCLKTSSFDGIDAILSVTPYYNKPKQKGLYMHFKTIANNSPVPVILYNVPGRTGVNMAAETTLRLANDVKNIIGVKEASGNLSQIMTIIKNKPENFMVISGDDSITLPLIAAGAQGVISVVANAYPFEFSEMVRLSLKGDFERARAIHYKLIEFMDALFADGSPAGIKAALEIMKVCDANLRLPLLTVNKPTYNLLTDLIGEIK